MKRSITFIDLKNIIFLATTLCMVIAGWFGFRERIAVLAADVSNNQQKLHEQKQCFEDVHHELKMLNGTVIRIQVLLEEHLKQ